MNLLELEALHVRANSPGTPEILRGVDFSVRGGETVGVVGESGSGKSMTMLATMGLLPRGVQLSGGRVVFDGCDLTTSSKRDLRNIRGKDIGLVFQDPMTALNPVMRIGKQIGEGIRRHDPQLSRKAVHARVTELLREVGIAQPAARARAFPHQFSGGMRQRVVIAMAMANRPRLLIADEPTSALDVTIQAQILALLQRVQEETGSALIMITHDLGVVAQLCQRVVVMYAGCVVEEAAADTIFHSSRHPYTRGLLDSLPKMTSGSRAELRTIGGQPPQAGTVGGRCPFHPRCFLSRDRDDCATEPETISISPVHRSACHFHSELAEDEVKQ